MKTMPDCPEPPLRLKIDFDALRANWQALDRLSGKARAGAAVKADGYGLGARQVVPALYEAGCRDFFVAHWCEAARLVDLVAAPSISVLHGLQSVADAAFAVASGIKPVINSVPQARRWLAAGGGACDLMVDTGMNRLGIPMSDLGDEALSGLEVDVLLSHLVAAEEENPLNAAQLRRWRDARAAIAHRRASLANSAGIALGDDYHGDLTRPGISLYGGIPRQDMASLIQQVVSPEAMIMQVRHVAPGESIGYNATYTVNSARRVGTISLGYADGYLRCWSGTGTFRAGDQGLPVLGRVSMDMTVIDLSEAPELKEGDWVTANYALAEASVESGLSQYELLTLLGQRFCR
jgi:alanine racemase